MAIWDDAWETVKSVWNELGGVRNVWRLVSAYFGTWIEAVNLVGSNLNYLIQVVGPPVLAGDDFLDTEAYKNMIGDYLWRVDVYNKGEAIANALETGKSADSPEV